MVSLVFWVLNNICGKLLGDWEESVYLDGRPAKEAP
jgi:hypothetical protein